jgi:hypothetical protein
MKYKLILFLILFLPFAQNITGQYYNTGQDPASLKWMQVNTGRFTVIYPESYNERGIAFAKSLADAYSKLTSIYPEKRFRIPVIIHNFTTQSNGYVAWAPRRMEIYPTPEQNTIPLGPDKQLALHELAHVFQMESLNKGFSYAFNIILGEQFTGIVSSLLPLWFFEGNAVFAESYLSPSGRGRSPSFLKELEAITVEKGSMYGYDKLLNGSFRDYVPDHYQSGYQMVTWALSGHDMQIWNKVLRFTSNQPFTLNPVNISLSRNAGLTKKRLAMETFDTLRTLWTNDISKTNPLDYKTLNPPKKGKYINYHSPLAVGNDSIIAVKTSLSSPAEFVLINPSQKSEKTINIPGQIYPYFISYADGKLVWVETMPDPRWENRNYSVIKIKGLRSNMTMSLTKKSRYLSASLSPDGKLIAAVENTIADINNLVILDGGSGKILQCEPSPANAFLQRPQWADDGSRITVIGLTDAGEGILSYTPGDKSWKKLVDYGREDLQSTFLRNDSLFYITSVSGTENIYLKTEDDRTVPMTKARFGATDLFVKGDKFIFSGYTSNGSDICTTSLAETVRAADLEANRSSFLIDRFDNEKILKESASTPSSEPLTPRPYRKWQHLLKFHSWMPFYADIEEIQTDPASLRPGFSLLSQNTLSSLTSSLGYEYSAEHKHVFHTNITWAGQYPVLESRLDYGHNPVIYKTGENVGSPALIQPGLRFLNTVYIPFRFSSGRFSQYLRPSFTLDYRNNYIYVKEEGSYDYGQTIFSGRLYFSNYRKTALRSIYPSWAQTIDLNYTFVPFDRNIYGTALSLKTAFFFPGIFDNNGLKIRIEKEKQNPVKYMFANNVSFPRGYRDIRSNELALLSADYFFPIAYPDFNISSLLYLKRLRADIFYDYATGTGNTYPVITPNGSVKYEFHNYLEKFSSKGLEVMADFHVLRIPFMISAGVQAAWKNFDQAPYLGMLFNIDLYGMTIGRSRL